MNESGAACVRIQPDDIFFKGLEFHLQKGLPRHNCWSNIDTCESTRTSTLIYDRLLIEPSPPTSLDYNIIDKPFHMLKATPKLIPGNYEEFLDIEDTAYNIVDNILNNAANILNLK